jgi:cell division septation protein DedD
VALTTPVPDATARSASRDGDAVAFATDSGLVVSEDRDPQTPWFVRLRGGPAAVAFTPSGHRIYVGFKDRSELDVVDRYQRRTVKAVPLPGAAGALRMDPWGRAVLIRPGAEQGAADEFWVVSMATDRVIGRIRAGWGSDLPTVSEGGVLLVRQGRAVVARDVRTLDPLGVVRDGAADLWFVGRWKPAMPTPAVGQQVLARASGPTPATSAATEPSQPSPAAGAAPGAGEGAASAPPADRIWVQVSVSQNERWARDLAGELARSGYRAHVVAPQTLGAGWRVVVGPYATRVVAESAARTLGRPYWIVERAADSLAQP